MFYNYVMYADPIQKVSTKSITKWDFERFRSSSGPELTSERAQLDITYSVIKEKIIRMFQNTIVNYWNHNEVKFTCEEQMSFKVYHYT